MFFFTVVFMLMYCLFHVFVNLKFLSSNEDLLVVWIIVNALRYFTLGVEDIAEV